MFFIALQHLRYTLVKHFILKLTTGKPLNIKDIIKVFDPNRAKLTLKILIYRRPGLKHNDISKPHRFYLYKILIINNLNIMAQL